MLENYYRTNFPTDSDNEPCAVGKNEGYAYIFFPEPSNVETVHLPNIVLASVCEFLPDGRNPGGHLPNKLQDPHLRLPQPLRVICRHGQTGRLLLALRLSPQGQDPREHGCQCQIQFLESL